MERLTKWENGHAYYPRCFEKPCSGGGCVTRDCPFETAICERLAAYEDTGLMPEQVVWMKEVIEIAFDHDESRVERAHELHVADKEGRVVVLPCKVGERWADADGRAVRITAVIVSIEPFGTNINIYFDDEGATPDDAGRACAANWDYFSRHYTCIEVERAMEDKKDA